MSLATRCTACGTIFRVVQDQLKVSEGWVRCGRCQAVFNAQESLFDLEREAPPPWSAPAAPDTAPSFDASAPDDPALAAPNAIQADRPEPVGDDDLSPPAPFADGSTTPGGSDSGQPQATTHDAASALAHDSHASTEGGMAPEAWTQPGPAWQSPGSDRAEPASALESESEAREPQLPIDPTGSDSVALGAPVGGDHHAPQSPGDDAASTPGFVQQAQRNERWERQPVRAALWLVTAVAALGLAWQVTHHFRNQIAAQFTPAAPWLQRYCAAVDCRIDALRQIDDVSIESTSLTQADAMDAVDGEPRALRLNVVLRNRGDVSVAMPSVDLSLTSTDGELVSRRSLSPGDFRVAEPVLPPDVDTALSLRFSVAGRRVSGYTVEVFYP